MLESGLAALFGLGQGLRHALEPDHVTALAAAVAPRSSARTGLGYAARWGAGHGLVLVVLGGACLVSGRMMPARITFAFELVVAFMLLALGARALRASTPARHACDREGLARRPLLIGCVHGCAGTGAVVAVALGSASTVSSGLVALGLYAFGAALGMVLLAGAAGPVLTRVGSKPQALRVANLACGALSATLGVVWGTRALVALVG